MAKRSRPRLKTTPLPEDDQLYSNEFVVGASQPKPQPRTSLKPDRGRGLPHRYPWTDSSGDPISKGPSTDDSET